MFTLNFDICLVPFHAILTEITVFRLKQTFLEPPRISWKGPIKTNWITFTIFLQLLFQLVGWFDEVSCSGSTLCWKKYRHERVPSNWLGQIYMCDSNNSGSEAQFERASWSDCYTACRNLKQQMIQNSFNYMISRARRWIHAVGHAFTDEYRRLFFNYKRERTDNKV
jgi:hypothetical protein